MNHPEATGNIVSLKIKDWVDFSLLSSGERNSKLRAAVVAPLCAEGFFTHRKNDCKESKEYDPLEYYLFKKVL